MIKRHKFSFQYRQSMSNKPTVVVWSSAALKYGIINHKGNNKEIVPDQNSLLSKSDDNTMKTI